MTSIIESINDILIETQNKGQEEPINLRNEIEIIKKEAQTDYENLEAEIERLKKDTQADHDNLSSEIERLNS